jgi:hypothetical protein
VTGHALTSFGKDVWIFLDAPLVVQRWEGGELMETRSLPDLPGYEVILDAFALSGTDIWAVGGRNVQGAILPYAVHFNGAGWSNARPPDVSADTEELRGVWGSSDQDVWAVGQ